METAERTDRIQLFKIHKSILGFVEKENGQGFWAYKRDVEKLLEERGHAENSIPWAVRELMSLQYGLIEQVQPRYRLRRDPIKWNPSNLKFRLAAKNYDGYAPALKLTERYKMDKGRIYFD